MIIDTAGGDQPDFWAYCWHCNHCCKGRTADDTADSWNRAQRDAKGGIP
jgi:hypothetical protein